MLALGLILVPVMGTATAGNPGNAERDSSEAWIDLRPVGGRLLYLYEDGSLWEETNGLEGLQLKPTVIGPKKEIKADVPFSGP